MRKSALAQVRRLQKPKSLVQDAVVGLDEIGADQSTLYLIGLHAPWRASVLAPSDR